MPLIVEDGTGLEDADTYVALSQYQSHAAAYGWGMTDTSQGEVQLRVAFDAINRLWLYSGDPISADQSGAFPRSGTSGIPKELKLAQLELAHRIAGGFDPFATQESSVTRTKKKVGPIEKEEETLPTGMPKLVAVEALLRPFLTAGAGQARVLRG